MFYHYAVDNGDESFTQLTTAYSISGGDHLAVYLRGEFMAYYSVTSETDGILVVSVATLPLTYRTAIVID